MLACLLIPIGTSTRTGLLCIGLVALLLLRETKRKFVYLGAIVALGIVVTPFLPKSYIERMGTIGAYKADESASTRVAVWAWTWEFAKHRPFGGGFEAYRQNMVRYDIVRAGGDTDNQRIDREVTTDRARAFHSAYFEMLGEQGYPGLALWLLLHLAGLVRMEVLRRRYRRDADTLWAGTLAGALQSAHLVYLLGAAFIGIAFQPFIYMLMGAEIGLDTYLARKRRAASVARPMPARMGLATP